MPVSRMIKPVFSSPVWTLFFVYLPTGELNQTQRFTLCQLKKLNRSLLIVCAAPEPSQIPVELRDQADALYWKGMGGYDFSGYAIGLHAIAARSPGADVFVLNDSVFGPFGDLSPWLDRARWDLTGFTGSIQVENHIQSYAFMIRNVTKECLHHLRSIFPTSFSYNDIMPVVTCFETRLARVASKRMTVGSFWFGLDGQDPSIIHAFTLLDQGYPFLKKALLGKHRDKHDEQKVRDALAARGLPAASL